MFIHRGLACLLLLSCLCAASDLRVDESSARLSGQADSVIVELPIHVSRPVAAQVSAELLDPGGDIVGRAPAVAVQLRAGENRVPLPLASALATLPDRARAHLLWLRLRYTVDVAGAVTTGLVSLGALQPDLFELETAYPERAEHGQQVTIQVLARHPVTRAPGAGVDLELFLDDSETAAARARTDRHGVARLTFTAPVPTDEDQDTIAAKVVGKRGLSEAESEQDLRLVSGLRVQLSTDKPLYQPGQPLYMRVLVLDSRGHAAPGRDITLEITDVEDNKVFSQVVRTNQYGIASGDWTIPEGLRSGPYGVKALLPDDEWAAAASVSIRRYDLPNFTVTATPDRKYYLYGQTPTVEVRADYLFGQPVKRGKVRVVRQKSRRWDDQQRQWVADEQQLWEGVTDEQGHFRTAVDLTDLQKELAEYTYAQFRDVTLAAYVTDPSTGRTEQRRFDLRLSRSEVHVYVQQSEWREGFPAILWVSTFYADGEPCACQVTIARRERAARYRVGATAVHKAVDVEDELRTVRTSAYGLAKITLQPPDAEEGFDLVLRARDQRGRSGEHSQYFWSYDDPAIGIATDKVIYRAGEPIRVTLRSLHDLRAVVYLASEQRQLRSRSVRLKRGQTSLVFPYQQGFEGELKISAVSTDLRSGYRDFIYGARSVLYPRDRRLQLDLRLGSKSYQPGDDALLNIRVRDGDGLPLSSALGIVITDRAVEARARADEEFGHRWGWGDYWSWWYGGRGFGAVSRAQLDQIDPSQPLPTGLDEVADFLLNDWNWPDLEVDAGDYLQQTQQLFQSAIEAQFSGLRRLEPKFFADMHLPGSIDQVELWAREQGISWKEMRDPWGQPYRAALQPEDKFYRLRLTSSGPDERFDTDDDLTFVATEWLYFLPVARAIEKLVQQVYAESYRLITDSDTLIAEARKRGLDLAAARDPWGRAYEYKIAVYGSYWWLDVSPRTAATGYPENIWHGNLDYFAPLREILDRHIEAHRLRTGRIPENQQELRTALKGSSLDLDRLRDPWGRPYRFRFSLTSLYSDKIEIGVAADHRSEKVVPTTSRLALLEVVSHGRDGQPEGGDDLVVAVFVQPLSLRTGSEPDLSQRVAEGTLPEGTGGIRGVVTDSQGAVISGATVTVSRNRLKFTTTTGNDGSFLLRGLSPGIYEVRVSAPNFVVMIVSNVLVGTHMLTTMNLSLAVGASGETVDVEAAAPLVESTSSQLKTSIERVVPPGISKDAPPPMFTPRLREYFPETLLWQPFIETDGSGRARIPFKLADNITTWKVSAVGTTKDGRFGTAEVDLLSFQPFFVEHDPPKILTDGDELRLSVPVRNFMAAAQTVQVKMDPAPWFELLSRAPQQLTVPAGDVSHALFPFRVTTWDLQGKQRITAANQKLGDAIEKPVIVRPHGEERTAMAADLLRSQAVMRLDLPPEAIPGTLQAELKLYPSVLSHLEESIEAVMYRPYGCAEQTISSAYPSLLMLQHLKSSGIQDRALAAKAERYLRIGYDRLLGYQRADGTFGYWSSSSTGDLALTAYAVRFLSEASAFIAVDEDAIADATSALIKLQGPSGEWRSRVDTSYIARTLALLDDPAEPAKQALQRALQYLQKELPGTADAYSLASYALAALSADEKDHAAAAVRRLRELAHQEDRYTSWSVETNTPFYGWGRAGRLETTALALQALQLSHASPAASEADALISRGLLYLLTGKDRYGVWFSGQATVNVLQALIAVAGNQAPARGLSAVLLVNGKEVQRISIPAAVTLTRIPLSAHLRSGENRVELRTIGASALTAVQAVASFYSPWPAGARAAESTYTAESSALRLRVTYQQTDGRIDQPLKCSVEVERIGHRGFGMLLAEIGLPPGAEVERESLVRAMKESAWDFQSYEVQPDRVVLYLWPRAGGSRLDFTFRPRFGMKARTAPSQVYDYYNPDARAVVAPELFVVTEAGTKVAD